MLLPLSPFDTVGVTFQSESLADYRSNSHVLAPLYTPRLDLSSFTHHKQSCRMARTKPLVCPFGAELISQRIQQDPNFIMINNREPCEAEEPPKDYNRAPMPNGRSLLLDLPGEIRNRVYEILAASTPWSLEQDASEGGAAVWSNKTQRMKSKSGLICVSRLVNQEFCSLLSLQ